MRERRGGLNEIQPGNWFWIISYINILLCSRIVYHIGAKSYYKLYIHIPIYMYDDEESVIFFNTLF